MKITPAQLEGLKNELRKHHLLGTGKKTIFELPQKAKDAFYTDLGKITLIVEDYNKTQQ